VTKAVVTFASPQHLGRYRVERALGSGGHSKVFLAWDEGEHGFRKRVALKVLPLQSKPGAAEALRREARLLAALNHPNVVDVYGIGSANGLHFIVMEYVAGSTLAEIRDELEHRGLRFPRSVACDIGIAVAEALYCAWNAKDAGGTRLNIVHRDLKPANVLMSRQGAVKVGDFGIAKAASDLKQTQGKRVKGTPSYMPPELMKGSRDFRPSMDLFSLGVMLWEMCTGHRFYGRVALHELLRKLDSRTPDEEAAAVAGYFPEIAPVVSRLLQRDPAERFQDPMEVARALRRIRAAMGVAPSLIEFSRLVRGHASEEGSVTSTEEVPSLLATPEDWEPLIEFARGRGRPSSTKPIRLVSDIREALALPAAAHADDDPPTDSATEDHFFEVEEDVEGTRAVAVDMQGNKTPTDLRFGAPRKSEAISAIERLNPAAQGGRSQPFLTAHREQPPSAAPLYWIALGVSIVIALVIVVLAG